jgi:hypothetical protein
MDNFDSADDARRHGPRRVHDTRGGLVAIVHFSARDGRFHANMRHGPLKTRFVTFEAALGAIHAYVPPTPKGPKRAQGRK